MHYTATWASATGEARSYLNGELVEEATDFKKDLIIKQDGILIIGQDQDSYGGGFGTNNAFSGSVTGLFWLRTALTPDQVSALYKDTLVHRDSTSSIPHDSEVVISWTEILKISSFHSGVIVFGKF